MNTRRKLSEFPEGMYTLETRKSEVKKRRKSVKINDTSITGFVQDINDESFLWFTTFVNPEDLDAVYEVYWAWGYK